MFVFVFVFVCFVVVIKKITFVASLDDLGEDGGFVTADWSDVEIDEGGGSIARPAGDHYDDIGGDWILFAI